MNRKFRIVLRNFGIGIFSQLLICGIGLLIPRIILVQYGSDTNGLINTVTQIFTYMALLEAGISQAATNAIYKPLKNNDKANINNIVYSAQRQFRLISIIYGGAVILLSFVLPFIIKTSVPYWTIFGVVLFEGLTNVVSFYFINSWTCLLNADGKNYIVNLINLLGRLLCYAIKICLALLLVNIALIEVGYFVVSIIKLLIFFIYIKKKYQWVKKPNNFQPIKFKDKNFYLVSEISSVIFQSTDIILLSIFMSTSDSSVYSIYNLVFVSLSTLLNSAFVAITYALNQTYIRDIEQYKKVHDVFNSVFMSIMCIFMCVSYFLIIPFVKLYTDGVTDINYINKFYPALFCLITLLSWSRYVPNNLMGISGNAKTNAIVSIIEASLNLIISLILVNFLGIIGVLIGTICSLPIRVIYLNYFADHKILKRNYFKTILINFTNYFIFGITILIAYFVGDFSISHYGYFILHGIILLCIYIPIVIGVNMLVNKDMINFIKILKKTKNTNI